MWERMKMPEQIVSLRVVVVVVAVLAVSLRSSDISD